MADVTVASGVSTDHSLLGQVSVVTVTKDIIYKFYEPAVDDLAYVKSLDGGLTWGSPVLIYDPVVSINGVFRYDVYPDWWTPGNTGTKINIVWLASGPGGQRRGYRSLDTADDSLTADVEWDTTTMSGSVHWHGLEVTIGRARSGRLHIHAWLGSGSGAQIHAVSEDEGATWDNTLAPAVDATGGQKSIILPGNEASVNDVWLFRQDNSMQCYLSVYDFAADSWTDTIFDTLTTATNLYMQWCAVTRHSDNHVILATWSETNGANADIHIYDITNAANITELTEVRTDLSNSIELQLVIDQANDDLYVLWLNGTPLTTVQPFYSLSTNGGTSWGASTALSASSVDMRWLRACPMQHPDGGRIQAFWWDDDADVIGTNVDLSVVINDWVPPNGDPLSGANSQKALVQMLADWRGNGAFTAADEDGSHLRQ